METKKPWLSKTVWVNALMAGCAFYPPAHAWMAANPTVFVAVWSTVGIGLRLITKNAVSLTE